MGILPLIKQADVGLDVAAFPRIRSVLDALIAGADCPRGRSRTGPAMTKLYGARWRIVDKVGEGGQGEVFRVVDTTGELTGEYALKRVKNPKRHARFESEIGAISQLAHPNIIELIDHSALTDKGERDDRQYLVMPLAKGGDLSAPDRLSLYQDDIDAVLKVAFQIASALEAAHAANIVHRDVKPQNILFKGIRHDTWLTDFGICLLRDRPRVTDDKEVVGPRAFMAPELEEGGQLNVTPAADIYSLGKVIFYMISNGQIVPRERLDDERFQSIFAKGERYHLLELLLQRMICLVGSRMREVSDVKAELEKFRNGNGMQSSCRLAKMGSLQFVEFSSGQLPQHERLLKTRKIAIAKRSRSRASRQVSSNSSTQTSLILPRVCRAQASNVELRPRTAIFK